MKLKIFGLLFVAFVILFLAADPFEQERPEEKFGKNSEAVNYLSEKYDAFLLADSISEFTQAYQSEILKRAVVLDSTIRRITPDNSGCIISLDVNAQNRTKIKAKLRCGKDIAERLNHLKDFEVYIAARIEKVSIGKLLADSTSVENEIGPLGDEILLAGAGLELLEKPRLYNLNTEN